MRDRGGWAYPRIMGNNLRKLTFLPLMSHVMCGCGLAFDVVQLATRFSPM